MNEYVDTSCPVCSAQFPMVSREGTRKTALGAVHKYYCKPCKRYFSERKFPGTKHSPRIIFDAVSLYNMGHTLDSVSSELKVRHHQTIPLSTLHSWINRYAKVCTFNALRNAYSLEPSKVILSRRFEHEQVYNYRVHTLKTNIVRKGRYGIGRYVYDILYGMETKGFVSGERCSEAARTVVFSDSRAQNIEDSIASKLCQMGEEMAGHNKERHDAVEDFFIRNDSATFACEVPVFATVAEIKRIIPNWDRGDLHGHIDLIQHRFGKIVILDYKPVMQDESVVQNQLSLYAALLAIRTRASIRDIRCGYFNGQIHKEFDPSFTYFKSTPSMMDKSFNNNVITVANGN